MLFYRARSWRIGGQRYLCVGSVAVSFVFAVGAFFQLIAKPEAERVVARALFEWLPAVPMHMIRGGLANFAAAWGFLLDPLSAVMILVVTGVGLPDSRVFDGYMAHEGGYYRFFGYLNLFMFSMLMLVLANNFLVMFVGWEGVGTVQLPADRILVPEEIGVGRGEESVHREPHG